MMCDKATRNYRFQKYRAQSASHRFRALALLFAGFIPALAGCNATYIAGSSTSPDGRYTIYGHIRGVPSHAYIDDTEKTVYLSIRSAVGDRKWLLDRKYRIRGSDVHWRDTWGEFENVDVLLYDYGPGKPSPAMDRQKPPDESGRRPLLLLRFHFVPERNAFVEAR